ncbi:unnamed protein product [Mytilus coruscus]|uniref:Uncharacterized protein n=1 Tax=Mytilus coruscus TaxID=42192 RepID=A0A6J8A0C2_MYTCO|nr:unnamed protein product [Mytilus coruscus]
MLCYILGLNYVVTTGLCIGLGGIFTIFAIISFFLYRKSKNISFDRGSQQHNSDSIDNENADDIYDVIDENTLYDDNIIVVYSDGSVSSSCHQCADNDNYLTPCSVDVELHYENKNFKTDTDSKESDSLSSINDTSNSGYLHPYQSLLSSTMENSNAYMSMYLNSMLECSKSTCITEKKTKSFSRRWSFTISDLLFEELTNKEPNMYVNSLGTHLKQTKTSQFTSFNYYEQLKIDQRELSNCYTTSKSTSKLKNTKRPSTKNFKFNTL